MVYSITVNTWKTAGTISCTVRWTNHKCEYSCLRPIHIVRFFLSGIALVYITWNMLHGCQWYCSQCKTAIALKYAVTLRKKSHRLNEPLSTYKSITQLLLHTLAMAEWFAGVISPWYHPYSTWILITKILWTFHVDGCFMLCVVSGSTVAL